MQFSESDLTFTFPTGWIVRRFDGTAAYRSVSGHGLKGVDFLCLPPGNELWLVEVKNYHRRHRDYPGRRRNPDGLAEQVGRKFSDSKRLIRVILRSMRRKWYLRMVFSWYGLHPRPRPKSHHWFWYEAERRLSDARRVRCVLWLESPQANPDYLLATRTALEGQLEPGNVLHLQGGRSPESFPIRLFAGGG
jgi:hypothetical protein